MRSYAHNFDGVQRAPIYTAKTENIRIHIYIPSYTVARAFLRLKTRGQYLHIIYNIYAYMYRTRHCDDPFKSSYIPFCGETAPDDDDRRVSWRYARDERAARAAFICVAKRSISSADGARILLL